MSKFIIILLMFFCITIIAKESTTQDFVKHNMTQEVLIDKMEKAIDPGGVRKKWKTLTYEIEMIFPAQKFNASGTGISKYPDKCKAVLKCPMATFIEVVNGKQAWSETVGKGIQMKTGLKLALAKFELKKSNPAIRITEVYEKITLDPVFYKFGKHKCYKLICTLPEEINVEPDTFFIDNKDFLIRWSASSQFAINKVTPIYRECLSYKKIKGVKVSIKNKLYMTGGIAVLNVLSLKINEKIADSEFELPKEKVK